jgi:alkaline phosphatase D
MRNYQYEYNRLMKHIAASKSEGIIFLSGDRHFSEILKDTSIAAYPVYDITCSPITSGVFHPEKTKEANNPLRIAGSLYASQNFSLISVTGSGKERILKIEWKNISGESVYVHEIPLTSLRASQSRK